MKKQWITFAVSLLLYAGAVAAVYFVPPLSVLLVPFLAALTASVKLSEQPPYAAWLLLLIAAAGTALLSGSIAFAGIFCVIPCLTGIYTGKRIKRGASPKQILLISGTGIALFLLALVALASKTTGTNILETVFTTAKESFSTAYTNALMQISADPELIQQFSELSDQMFKTMYQMFPYMLIVLSAVLGYISLWMAAGVSRLFKADYQFRPGFSCFKCSSITAGILVVSALVMLFAKEGVLAIVCSNIYAITSFLLSICALSLLDYWMKSKNWFILIRIVLLCALYFAASSLIGTLLLCVIAFADARLDFRKLES